MGDTETAGATEAHVLLFLVFTRSMRAAFLITDQTSRDSEEQRRLRVGREPKQAKHTWTGKGQTQTEGPVAQQLRVDSR